MVLEMNSFRDEKQYISNGTDKPRYGGTGQRGGPPRTRISSISCNGPEHCTLTWENINIWAPTVGQGCVNCRKGSPTSDDGIAKQILHDGK